MPFQRSRVPDYGVCHRMTSGVLVSRGVAAIDVVPRLRHLASVAPLPGCSLNVCRSKTMELLSDACRCNRSPRCRLNVCASLTNEFAIGRILFCVEVPLKRLSVPDDGVCHRMRTGAFVCRRAFQTFVRPRLRNLPSDARWCGSSLRRRLTLMPIGAVVRRGAVKTLVRP